MPSPSPKRLLVIAPGVSYQVLFQAARGQHQYWKAVSNEQVWDAVGLHRPTKLIAVNTAAWPAYTLGGVVALCRQYQIKLIRHAPIRALPNQERAYLELGLEEPNEASEVLAHLLTHLDELERDHLYYVVNKKGDSPDGEI